MSRIPVNFNTPKVKQTLPEYFQSDYPKFVRFIELYMDFVDSGFGEKIKDLKTIKDINGTDKEYFDSILYEMGQNLSSSRLSNPREFIKNLPNFYRHKGTKVSAQMFFRSLFDDEVVVEYPKRNLFVVGQSKLGYADQKILQDGRLNQPLSILLKTSQPIKKWEALFKKFVHPAGFYLGGEIEILSSKDLNLKFMPEAIDDTVGGNKFYSDSVELGVEAKSAKITGEVDGKDTDLERSIKDNDLTLEELSNQYDSIEKLDSPNRPITTDTELDTSNDYETTDGTYEQSVKKANTPQ